MTKEERVQKYLEEGKDFFEKRSYELALNRFLEAFDLDEQNAEIRYYLGIVNARMGRYEKAAAYLSQVLDSELAFINKIHTQMILGYIYTIQERYDEAFLLFKDILDLGLESAQAYAAIGFIMDRQGRFKEAIMHLYRAIEIDPDNANAHNSLGYIFAESNLNLDEALKECRKAVSLDGDNPAYLDSLGWVYYKLGQKSQARSYLKKALRKAHANREIKDHLETVMEELSD
jgi:tetratricopeptide (TPR) repeat protein